jgi:hypothetical protein
MADSSFRSFRRDSPARENEPSQRDGLSDPLAELARLIGQGGGQDGGHQPPEPNDGGAPASEFDWASVNENDGYAANRHENGYDDRSREPASWPLDEGYENEPAAPRQSFPPVPPFNGARGGAGQNARSYDLRAGQSPAQSRAQPFPFIPPAPDNGYRADDSGQHHDGYAPAYDGDYADDDYDDEAEPRRRSGTVVIAALLGLAVLGTAGALGYRALSGGSVIPAFPPIIKPADGPIRVKPDQQAQASNSGQPDSAKGTGEQVVTNQEQPVDVQSGNPIPRMIKTIPVVPSGSPDAGLAGGQSPATVAQTSVPPPGYAEPVAVPPQPFAAAQPPAPVPQVPTVSRPARIPAGPPAQQAGSSAAGGPTASVARPAPVARPKPPPKRTAAAESPSAGGPLSIVPQQEAAPPPVSSRVVHTATNNAAASVPLTSSAREQAAPAAVASYVQVSSQRSEAEAQAAYRGLQVKFPQQLGSRHAVFHRADLGDKGVYYRALVGPFATAEQASAFCTNLKAAGGSCFMQRN